jgi:hypothetical protein
MKRRFRWLSRKEVGDADPSPQYTTAPLPERPKPRAFTDSLSSTPSRRHLSAADSLSPPSSTIHTNDPDNTSTQNVQHSTPRDGTSSGANTSKKDYWQLAVDQLQEEDSSIADRIAGVQQAAAATGNTDFAAQLLHTTQQTPVVTDDPRPVSAPGS